MNSRNKFAWQGSLDHLVMWAFLASGAVTILLFSPHLLGRMMTSWAKAWVNLLPWILLWLVYGFKVVDQKAYRIELSLILIILVLAILNVALSDNPRESYYAMVVFLSSGFIPFWSALLLGRHQQHRWWFAWFCTSLLAVVALSNAFYYFSQGGGYPDFINLFTGNPIPEGSLLILLSVGPLTLLKADKPFGTFAAWLLLLLSLGVILLSERRGALAAAAIMLLVWAFARQISWGVILLVGLLAVAVLFPFRGLVVYKPLDPNIPSHFNILHRLELYPFAWHVFQRHPWLGTGLRPHNLPAYLADYRQINQNLTEFAPTVRAKTTLDNMYLTFLVECGSLLTSAYVALVGWVAARSWPRIKSSAGSPNHNLLPLLPLLGLLFHSLAYDSLTFPQINWLFHVQLGFLASWAQEEVPSTADVPFY